MSYDPEPSIAKYLQRLDEELRGLPRDRRREVVNEIAEHIEQAREASPVRSEADLRNLLDRIGTPSEIAAEARERFDVSTKSNWHEIAAIVLLLVGGFVFLRLAVGVVLLVLEDLDAPRQADRDTRRPGRALRLGRGALDRRRPASPALPSSSSMRVGTCPAR